MGRRTGLDRLTNILVILTCIGALAFALHRVRHETALRMDRQPYRVGDRMGQLESVDYTKSTLTLVIVTSTWCKYCEASVPFYRDLFSDRATWAHSVQIVFGSVEDVRTTWRYLIERSLPSDAIVQLRPGTDVLSRAPTPAIVVVSTDGRVAASWVGVLSRSEERQLELLVATSLSPKKEAHHRRSPHPSNKTAALNGRVR